MVNVLVVKKLLTDKEIELKEGEYFNEEYYRGPDKYILDDRNDYDVYKDSISNDNLLFKIRRDVIESKYSDKCLKSFRNASKKKHENRGAAAGILDRNKMPKYIGEFINPGKFRTNFISNTSNKKSKQLQSNYSKSNIVGYYDKADRNLRGKGEGVPCRLTAFNRDYPKLWKKSLPYIKRCNKEFKKLVPDRYKNQRKRAKETKNFIIKNTAYSTITINYSWRTALHRDSGDYKDGFGNLTVIEDKKNKNRYKGCYLGYPQYGICVDVRTGDYLAMDVHEWHANTEFIPVSDEIFLGNFTENDILNDWHYNRLSMVMYLRENMIKCKDNSLQKKKNKLEIIKNKLPVEYINYMIEKYKLFI